MNFRYYSYRMIPLTVDLNLHVFLFLRKLLLKMMMFPSLLLQDFYERYVLLNLKIRLWLNRNKFHPKLLGSVYGMLFRMYFHQLSDYPLLHVLIWKILLLSIRQYF